MRKGDKLICKNQLEIKLGVTTANQYDTIIVDKLYEIVDVKERYVYVKCEIFNEPFHLYDYAFGFYLYDYFYTPQEYRKLKLYKLNLL